MSEPGGNRAEAKAARPPLDGAVFLDRDGVINALVYNAEFGTVDSPANPGEYEQLPGVGEAVARLNALALRVIVASNQPGIAKGKLSHALLDEITAKMKAGIEAGGGRLDAVYYCLHHPEARVSELRMNCDCRKPRPGLLLRAAREWNLDLARCYLVGDGISDIQAGAAAGVRTFFLSSRKCYICDELVRQSTRPGFIAASLGEAASLIEKLEAGQAVPEAEFRFPCGTFEART